jgi:AraC-like DNA-binding protein
MDKLTERFLGEGPFPFQIDNIEDSVELHKNDRLMIIFSKKQLDLFEAVHSHESYEFMASSSHSIPARMEGHSTIIEKNELCPFNTEQAHGPGEQLFVNHIMAVQIEKDFLQEIARSAYRKPEVVFDNEGITLGRDLQSLIQLFMIESRQRQAGYEFILQSLGTQIAVELLRQAKSNLPVLPVERNYAEKKNISRAVEFIREYYTKSYSLEEVARVANLSPYHFIRVFKAQTGKTPYGYLLDVKIEKAREMLKFTGISITDVCLACGFNNLSHFTSVFKRKVGISPSDYRKALGDNGGRNN